jgi:hypothetical protein
MTPVNRFQKHACIGLPKRALEVGESKVSACDSYSEACIGLPGRAPELGEGKVGIVDCLAALLAHDAHADVGRLNHRHVIRAVAYSQHALTHARMRAPLYEPQPPAQP